MYLRLAFWLLLSVGCFPAFGAVVKNLFVERNRFIETPLIKKHLRLKSGKPYSLKKIKKDVKSLYALGFFQNVEVFKKTVSKNYVDVIYRVSERPLIGKIEFEGNKELSKEDLKELLTVKEYEFLSFKELESTLTAIKEKYRDRGYFLSEVSYKIKPLEKSQGKVRLMVQIDEKERVLIKKINFIGNRRFPSKKLKSLMKTRERGILGFLDSSGIYNPLHLDRDRQLLEYLYRNEGYLNVRFEKPEITLTANKRHIYISLAIHEGHRFLMGQMDFIGDEVVSKEEVLPKLSLKKRKFFSLGAMLEDIKFIENLYKEKGFAFAKASPDIFPDKIEDNKIHIRFQTDRGAVYEVGKITVSGNNNTRDKVILRQMMMEEGAQYKKSKQEESQLLIRRLGFFEEVDLNLKKRPDREETLDIEVQVKEREHTGEAQLAGGYNSFHKVFVRGSVKKTNFLGLGHTIGLQVGVSQFNEMFNFNYHNPYFMDTNWSLNLDIFNTQLDNLSGYDDYFFSNSRDRILSYSQMNRGFSLSLGRHITQYFSAFLKYRLQQQSFSGRPFLFIRKLFGFGNPWSKKWRELQEDTVSFDDIYNLKEAEGWLSTLAGIFEYDKRNDRYYTTQGYYGQLSLEYAGLGGDFNHTKIQANARHYQKLFWKLVLKNNLNFGAVFPNKKGGKVLFTELFLLGGPYSLRGFFPNTVGPRKTSDKALAYAKEKGIKNPEIAAERPYGGSKMFYYNLELEAPIISEIGLLAAVFFDMGEAANNFSFNWDDGLRANTGAGLRWRSPFGLIRLDWGIPFFPREELGEQKVQFQFTIGSSF